jgi:hypothetical protein
LIPVACFCKISKTISPSEDDEEEEEEEEEEDKRVCPSLV